MKVIEFIKSLNYVEMTATELALKLEANGYSNWNNNPYSEADVEDLIRPLYQVRTYSKKGFGGCGIDRDRNPCGDASDY